MLMTIVQCNWVYQTHALTSWGYNNMMTSNMTVCLYKEGGALNWQPSWSTWMIPPLQWGRGKGKKQKLHTCTGCTKMYAYAYAGSTQWYTPRHQKIYCVGCTKVYACDATQKVPDCTFPGMQFWNKLLRIAKICIFCDCTSTVYKLQNLPFS